MILKCGTKNMQQDFAQQKKSSQVSEKGLLSAYILTKYHPQLQKP
ncbi:hypothetical protein BVRB_6g151390 [Beta vulgaris subsp. vulgaris]|nr:hypothetical protein BVRB_6g151390 [Beta vulgaris subsp. vulgaris]